MRLLNDAAFPVSVSFLQPLWLALVLPLGVLVWWLARGSLATRSDARRVILIGVRVLVITLFCVALAEPSVQRRAVDVATIVIRDHSASIPVEQQRLMDDFLAASAAFKRPSDRLGVITTARDAFVQSIPLAGPPNLDIGFVGDTGATNLQEPIALARAMIPPNAGGRILLLTDALQTVGSVVDAARAAGLHTIPIDVAGVTYDRSRQIVLSDVVVPAWTRQGDTVSARVVVNAGRPAPARLSVLVNDRHVDLDPESSDLSAVVQLQAGPNVFTVPAPLSDHAVHRIRAIIDPIASSNDPDARASPLDTPDLLTAESVTFSNSRGRVLLLTDDAAAAAPFIEAVASPDVTVEARDAEGFPDDFAELAGYDAVILADQPASSYSLARQEDLVRYVRDTGGGLIVLGGPNALGAGGWIGSPLAETLPVLLDPPSQRKMPKGALALVIDCSGSMSSPVGNTGRTQQQVANEAAIFAVRSLSRLDDVTIVSFNTGANVVVPLTPAADQDAIARDIRNIASGGGTYMFPGVEEAAAQLAGSNAGARHIIVLTDGQSTGDAAQSLALAASLKRSRITLSAVAIGDIPNTDLLMRLAQAADGRSYVVQADNAQAILPRIFIKEAQLVRRSLIREGTAFTPALTSHADSLAGIPTPYPALTGYVVTAERPGLAMVPIRGPERDPILAQWQHGLGRVTVFTSDAAARWSTQWTGWSGFGPFWKQQLDWTMRSPGDALSRVTVSPEDAGGVLVGVELFDEAGDHLSFARVRGRLAGVAKDIEFRQTAPGRYESRVRADTPGLRLLSIDYLVPGAGDAAERRGSLRAAINQRASDEMVRPVPDMKLLEQVARITNGRVYALQRAGADLWVRDHVHFPTSSRAIWLVVALAALGLFIVDVGVRRIAVDPRRVLALFGAAPVAARSGALRNLSEAKARAAAETRRAPTAASPAPDVMDEALKAQEGRGGRRTPTTIDLAGEPARPPAADPAFPAAAAPTEPSPGDDPMARLRAAKNRARPK